MKRIILALIIVLQYLPAKCQQQNEITHLPNVMPVSPKSFEFQKYTEVPVGKYTGVPNISIPVFNIKTNGLELPISLSYHSNGIKVNEEASWVGLGWALFSGGNITQIVKGFDDFGIYKWRDNEARSIFNACMYDLGTFGNHFDVWITPASTAPVSPGANPDMIEFHSYGPITAGNLDVEPDLFNFNVPGYSGQFILDWNTENFVCITDKNIRIENKGAEGAGFVIKTPDGNVFEFENIEGTVMSGVAFENSPTIGGSPLGLLQGQKSSRNYQMTAIYTSKGDKISMNYLPPTALLENYPSISASTNSYLPATGIPLSVSFESFKTINYSQQSFSYLSSIDFPDGSVIFNSSDDRTDFIGTRRLNSILVKDKRGVTIKSYDFNYDYFIGDVSSNTSNTYLSTATYNTHKTLTELTNRLKLTGFNETGLPGYTFEYNQQKLPQKTSYAYDHWGFFNGKTSSDLFPDFHGLTYDAINSDSPFSIVGLNRASDFNFCQAALLNKIIYPTGGAAAFQYELNTFGNHKIQDDAHSTTSQVYLSDNNVDPSVASRAYLLDANATSGIDGQSLNLNTFGNENFPNIASNTYIRLTIIKKTPATTSMINNNAAQFWNTYFSVPLGQLQSQISDVQSDTKIVSLDFNASTQQYETFKLVNNYHIDVDPRNYYIIETHLYDAVGPQNTSSSSGHSSASGYFQINQNRNYLSVETSHGAGLRIKTIQTTDNNGSVLTKNYRYNDGVLMGPIRYLRTFFGNINGTLNVDEGTTYQGFWAKTTTNCSSFFAPSTSGSGSYVGYSSVSESNSALDGSGSMIDNACGAIEDRYTNQPDITFFHSTTTSGNRLVIFPNEKYPIDNGLSLLKIVSDNNGNVIQRTENFYSEAPYTISNRTYGRLSAHVGMVTYQGTGQNSSLPVTSLGFYPIFAKKTLLDSTKVTTYSGAGQSVNTLSANLYDSHDQVYHSWKKTSDNKIIHTYLKHPYDFSNSVALSLTSQGIIAPVIEQKTALNTQETVFDQYDYQLNTSQPYPVFTIQKSERSFKGLPLEDLVLYDLYGSSTDANKNKLLQFHGLGKPPTSILWGYNGQYPVAEVVGADYNTIAALVNQNMLDNASLYSDAQVRSELNKLRIALISSAVSITTYTYSPLVGMTSMTDQKGMTTFYEYDAFQRLTNVKEANGKILKHVDYHYKQ